MAKCNEIISKMMFYKGSNVDFKSIIGTSLLIGYYHYANL